MADDEIFKWNNDIRVSLGNFAAGRQKALANDMEMLRKDVAFWRESIVAKLAPSEFWSVLSKTIDSFQVEDANVVHAMLTANKMEEEDVYEQEASLITSMRSDAQPSKEAMNMLQSRLVEEVQDYARENDMTLSEVKLMLATKSEATPHSIARWL